jgi:hypothetical protein
VKESRLIEDYLIEIVFEGERGGTEVWEFALTPQPEAPVVWGRIQYEVRKDDLLPTWARYYDEDDDLIRTLTFSEYRMMGGRQVPALMMMVPEDKPSEKTVVRYSELEFDIDINKGFFSLRALQSGGD